MNPPTEGEPSYDLYMKVSRSVSSFITCIIQYNTINNKLLNRRNLQEPELNSASKQWGYSILVNKLNLSTAGWTGCGAKGGYAKKLVLRRE